MVGMERVGATAAGRSENSRKAPSHLTSSGHDHGHDYGRDCGRGYGRGCFQYVTGVGTGGRPGARIHLISSRPPLISHTIAYFLIT